MDNEKKTNKMVLVFIFDLNKKDKQKCKEIVIKDNEKMDYI